MYKNIVLYTLAFFVLGALALMAGDEVVPASVKTSPDVGTEVTMTGTLVCLGCSLKSAGAQSACSIYGCSHALKSDDGKYVSFLQNDFSQQLIKGTDIHNKQVSITGVYFAKANVLDVHSYKVEDGPKTVWCEGHKSMDACAAH